MRYLQISLTFGSIVSMLAMNTGAGLAQARLPAIDPRPVGKYLYALCSVDPVGPSTCQQVRRLTSTLQQRINRLPQKTSVTQVCDLDGGTDCTGIYPVVKDGMFYLKTSSDSGATVDQIIVAGPVTRVGVKDQVVQYHVLGTGTILIRAVGQGTEAYQPAPPVDLLLQSVQEVKAASSVCNLIPATAPSLSQVNPVDATALVSLLGNPTPFLLTAPSSQVIAVYTTRQPVNEPETKIYDHLVSQIRRLSRGQSGTLGTTTVSAAKPFSVVLRIPHASALGDLVTRFNSLNYSQFTLQDVGRDELRITSSTTPECTAWKAFLDDIKRVEWQVVSSQLSTKLFYLSASDVATAYTGLSPAAAVSTPPAATAAGGGTSATSAAASAPAGVTTISASQPPGTTLMIQSDGTSCVTAGMIAGTSVCGAANSASAANPSSAAPAATSSVAPAPPPALQMNAMSVITGITEQVPPDILIFNDGVAGDDAQVVERMRIMAQLDLPRPEMIFTAWIAQNSSTKQQAVAAFSDRVQSVVRQYNDEFEQLIERGWNQLKILADGPNGAQYYNRPFMRYVSDLYIADTYKAPDPKLTDSQQLAQNYLDYSTASIAEPTDASFRETHKICPKTQYCLGYTSLFRADGIEPRLTDLLLAIIAAQDPLAAAKAAVVAIQGNYPLRLLMRSDCNNDHCKAMWDSLSLEAELRYAGERNVNNPELTDCAALDQLEILDAAVVPIHEPNVRLHCFSRKAKDLLSTDENAPPPNHVGLLRAAIANFLFNYKMSQEFPHEFVPYDLTTSANDLNNQLGPLIEAFNDDLKAYQLFVRADLQYQAERLNSVEGPCCVKRLFGLDKPSFYNDALVTVRTISGQATAVNTTSQNTLNASLPPSISALVTAAAAGAATGTSAVTSGQRLAAAIAQFQTTSVQLGRSLNVNITPRALSTASSAEITVSLQADDTATTPLFSGASSTDAAQNNSRVSQHDVTTRVRVNSIKLFNLSSFTAVVERSHGRFPLLPPFIEIPYIGTFAGIPLGTAKEFHSSNAIISAYVVPTAADLAFGLRFQHDLLVDSSNPGPCRLTQSLPTPNAPNACIYRPIYANRDIGINKPSFSEFNRQMVGCLKSNTRQDGCSSVSFDDANALANY